MITLNSVELPFDLLWVDEFKYSTVAQNKQRTLTGALILQESQKLEGVPITLVGGQNSAWISREKLLELQQLVDTEDSDMVLTFHDDSYTVRFDRAGSSSPVMAEPIAACSMPTSNTWYGVTIKLMTV